MGLDNRGERKSLRGDDTVRTNSAQESSLEEVWLQQGLEGEVGLELWGEERQTVCGQQRGDCMFGQGISREENCLEQLGGPYCLSWEPVRARSWAVTWHYVVRSKMSRLCPQQHLTQGSQETCTRMFKQYHL